MPYYAVIFNKDLDDRKKDQWIPMGWPMFLSPLKKDEWPQAGIARLSLDEIDDIKNQLWPEYEKLQQDKKLYNEVDRLWILDLVAYEFKDWHPSKIDFTKHLKNGVFLEKREVQMLKNGRPVKSIYYYGQQKVAEILFEFESDELNFMTRRTEKLGYFSKDGDIHEHWTISDEFFSGSNTYQHSKRLQERTAARQLIVDSLRADIDKFLTISAQQNPTMSSALSAMINAFWVEYNPHLSAFINSGGTYLRTKFATDTTYPFLNSLVAPGVSVKAYIVDKLTY
jgi:lysozyme family protein